MASSKAMVKFYRNAFYWCGKLEWATNCMRAKDEAGVEYTEAERARLWEASRKFDEAKTIFTEVWSARIGQAVAYEARVEVQ
jgi:hypothetical protein